MANGLQAGDMLIANPHLDDPNFLRSVILLCEHNNDGALGFVINRKTNYVLQDALPEMAGCTMPVYEGGPVAQNTLHFIHRVPQLINDGAAIGDGIYWGGNFQEVMALLLQKKLSAGDIKIFRGYSGWETGQLEAEMEERTWITAPATQQVAFINNAAAAWKTALQQLGGEYQWLVNAPLNPSLN